MVEELLAAAMEVVHLDDDGLNLWAYANGPHASGCTLCRAISTTEMVLLVKARGLVR